MPRYSPETKSAARAGQEAAEWSRSISGALGIEGNPRLLYAAAFFDLLARVAGRIYEDPPRRDFTTSTHVRPTFATPAYIATDDSFERMALEAAQAADDSERRLAAHLRAFERLQGALAADRKAEADQRAIEAERYAQMGAHSLYQLADPVTAIAEQLAAGSSRERDTQTGRRGRPSIDEVSEDALALLFLGGLRIRDLENILSGTRLEDTEVAVEHLLAAAENFRDFGRAMDRWVPPRDVDLAL